MQNLSEMDAAGRAAVLARASSGICATYETDEKGALIAYKDLHGVVALGFRLRSILLTVLALVAPPFFSSCSTTGKIVAGSGDKEFIQPRNGPGETSSDRE